MTISMRVTEHHHPLACWNHDLTSKHNYQMIQSEVHDD